MSFTGGGEGSNPTPPRPQGNNTPNHSYYHMISKKNLAALALAASVSTLVTVSAQAANPDYVAGDLILFFQNPGGTLAQGNDQLLFVNLGDTALDFRGAGAGIEAGQPSISLGININAALTTAFGANWATSTTLNAGFAGVWGTSQLNSGLQNGDPHRTVYASNSRNTLGTLGTAGSSAWVFGSSATSDAAAGGITGSLSGYATDGTGGIFQLNINQSTLDENAPVGSTQYGAFTAPGIYQAGTAGTLGSLGGVNNIEFALDLYRILARTNVAGQVGGPFREGSYEGTVVLSSNGELSFLGAIPVPEPSSALLVAGMIGVAGFVRRRSSAR